MQNKYNSTVKNARHETQRNQSAELEAVVSADVISLYLQDRWDDNSVVISLKFLGYWPYWDRPHLNTTPVEGRWTKHALYTFWCNFTESHPPIHSFIHYITRTAQFYIRPADYLPLHFGLNFLNPSYIYIRACNIIHMCNLYHSVHKSTMNNANLWKIGLKIFSWMYWFENLFSD